LASHLSVAKSEIVREENIDVDMLNSMIEATNQLQGISSSAPVTQGLMDSFYHGTNKVWGNDNAAFFSIDARSVDQRFNAFRSYLIQKHGQVAEHCQHNSMMGSVGFNLYVVISSRIKEWRARGATVYMTPPLYIHMCIFTHTHIQFLLFNFLKNNAKYMHTKKHNSETRVYSFYFYITMSRC
jgi:hypothetical protein